MVGAAVVLAGCVPLMRGTLTQVRAIGWTPEGAAIGLAQKIDVGRDFYLVSPEGGGTFSGFRERGIFVLVRVDGEIPADHRVDERRLQFDSAFARPNADGFVVLLSDRGWKTVCVLVSLHGGVSPCGRVAYNVDTDRIYLAGRSGELRFRGGRMGPNATYWAVDPSTGRLSEIADPFLTLGLRGTREPCDMSITSLSPNDDAWVVACTIESASIRQTGIWLLRAGSAPVLLHALEAADLVTSSGSTEDRPARYMEQFGLAWSPDQRQIYWCGARGQGILLSVVDGRSRGVSRCLKLATWSLDGTKIAGVENHQLVELRILEGG